MWVDNMRDGKGVYTWAKYDIMYDGCWKMDKQHGEGTYVYEIGERYIGQWKQGKREGEGIFHWKNGARYEGGFANDMRNGEGTYHRKHASNQPCMRENKKQFG